MSTSLGTEAHCDTLVVRELGSSSNPVETIHRASTDRYQNDLNWVDADTGHTRLRLKEDGHLQCVEDIEFFSGPSINTGIKKYSIGLNSDNSKFQIVNETTNQVIFDDDNAGGVSTTYLQANYYDHVEIDNQIDSLDVALTGKIPTSRLGPQGVSPTTVDRTDTTSDLLVTEQSLLNWVGGNLTEGGTPYQIVQPKLYITDSANTREINSQDGQGNDIVEFIKARVNSSKDGGFDSTR